MLADPEHRWDISTMTVKEALASWKGPAVKAAMEEEICCLINMGTWELVERPPGVNIMKNRRVLTTKYHVDDTVEREKARLVVKGFTQVYDADNDETFASVGSYVTLRIFRSIAAVLNLNLMQLDMKNAFLQSKLDRVLYMSRPDYFNDGTGRVCKLLKSLYGLKQSPLLWYLALNDVLVGAGWKKSQVDEALYFKVGKDGVACWVLVYVDDLLAASSSTEMLKELLESAFELREISPVQKYLGLEIVRERSAGKLWLHQQGYVDKLRRRFIDEEQTGRTPKTPVSVDAYAELTFDDEEVQERQEEVYRQKVGSLQFAATTTRPDVAFACSKLGSGLTVRSDQHWREVDRCLAYLANTRDTALEFSGGPESLELVGYVDADDAGDKQNRTNTGGYVFLYGGAAVSWSSQRIKCAMLSSTESEYAAATEAGKEGRQLRFLLAEFQQLDAGKPTILWVDNKSAITLAEGMGLTGNLKHMERRQAWLQHMVKRGKFSLRYIPTAEQLADFLTKALHYPAFNQCSVAIGQVRLADVGDEVDEVQGPSVNAAGECQRELCVGPRPRLGGADFVVGCTGGTANLQQWATPTWASWSTGLVDLHGATAIPPTWEAGGRLQLGGQLTTVLGCGRPGEVEWRWSSTWEVDGHIQEHLVDVVTWGGEVLQKSATVAQALSARLTSVVDKQEDFECLAAAVPHLVAMLLAHEEDPDAPDIMTTRSYAEAITAPFSSQWLTAMDAEMASWKSTVTYVDAVPPFGMNLVDRMWTFRFPGGTQWSLRQPVYSLRQAPCELHDTLRMTLAALWFAPATGDPSLFLRTDTLLPPFYVLVCIDDLVFATADTETLALVKSELQKRHTCTDPESQMVHQVLQGFGFRYSSPQSTPLPTGHSLSAPPLDESVELSGPYPELVGCLMYLMTCTRPELAYHLSILARYVAPGRHRPEHWEAAKRVLRYLRYFWGSCLEDGVQLSSLDTQMRLGSSCEAEIYAGAMAAQELRWLMYVLTDWGERPRSPPVLYVDNKAMIALCQEHRLEHRMKHIALSYFLA
ncbi:unnamed protein product [Closterium sp. NIES-53]